MFTREAQIVKNRIVSRKLYFRRTKLHVGRAGRPRSMSTLCFATFAIFTAAGCDSESTWVQLSTSGPSPRAGHAMAYDASRDRLVLFGGNLGGGVSGDDT